MSVDAEYEAAVELLLAVARERQAVDDEIKAKSESERAACAKACVTQIVDLEDYLAKASRLFLKMYAARAAAVVAGRRPPGSDAVN